jgi:hypothetical protein
VSAPACEYCGATADVIPQAARAGVTCCADTDACRLRAELPSDLLPCSDRNCVLLDMTKPRGGMHTNGGCEHLSNGGPATRQLLRTFGAEIVRLRAERRDLRAAVNAIADRLHADASGTIDVVEAPVVRAHIAELRKAGA